MGLTNSAIDEENLEEFWKPGGHIEVAESKGM